MKQVMLVADVGGLTDFHAGDEAILTARLAWIRKAFPGMRPLLLSEDPAYTAKKHQCGAVQEPQLPPGFEEKQWFFRVHRHAPSLAREHLLRQMPGARATLQALRECGLLYICGGGNLRSAYRRLLWLRSLLAMHAQAHHIPVVVTGVQIGPDLAPDERRVLSQWMPRCAIVGMRDDGASWRLARELGIPDDRLIMTGDDALDLEARPPSTDVKRITDRPAIGLSLHQQDNSVSRPEFLSQLTQVLKPWLQACASDVVFLPHRYSVKPERDDVRLARELIQALGGSMTCHDAADTDGDEQVLKHLTGKCQFLLTTQFHAAVFAMSQGIPVCAIAQDGYTAEKLNGLFKYLGLETRALNWRAPDLGAKIQAAWLERDTAALQVRTAWDKALPGYHATRARIERVLDRLMADRPAGAEACAGL